MVYAYNPCMKHTHTTCHSLFTHEKPHILTQNIHHTNSFSLTLHCTPFTITSQNSTHSKTHTWYQKPYPKKTLFQTINLLNVGIVKFVNLDANITQKLWKLAILSICFVFLLSSFAFSVFKLQNQIDKLLNVIQIRNWIVNLFIFVFFFLYLNTPTLVWVIYVVIAVVFSPIHNYFASVQNFSFCFYLLKIR